MKEHKEKPLEERDAPGKLISWLCAQSKVHNTNNVFAYEISGRYDIGNIEDYRETLKMFKRAHKSVKSQSSLKSVAHSPVKRTIEPIRRSQRVKKHKV